MFQRMLPVLLALAHVALWAAAFTTLGTLEGPYPTHFDLEGRPNAWTDAGWWLLPLIGLGITAVLLGAVMLGRRLVVSSPQWVNMPKKYEWVRLPVEARLRSFKAATALVFGFAVFVNLMLVSVTLDTYAVARGAQEGISVAKMVLVLVCLAVWLVLSVLRIRQVVREEVRLARESSRQEALDAQRLAAGGGTP